MSVHPTTRSRENLHRDCNESVGEKFVLEEAQKTHAKWQKSEECCEDVSGQHGKSNVEGGGGQCVYKGD